jgi:protease-4
MYEPPPRRSILGRLWGLVDATRRTLLNLLFLAIVIALLWAALKPGTPALEDRTALVMDLSGPITEQTAGDPRDLALQALAGGEEPSGSRLRDVVAVIDAAAADPKVPHLLLKLDGLGPAGLPTLREVAAALQRFKAAGKPVYAWGAMYDQRAYYLAAQADAVWLHPMGLLFVEGFGRPRSYYKDAFDKVGVQATVLRAGQYKSFGEVYSANGPSPQAQEADKFLYDAMWARWLADVEGARKLAPGTIAGLVDALPDRLAAAGGDLPRTMLAAKMVDALKTPDELRAFLIEKGAKDEDTEEDPTFRQVSFSQYLARLKPPAAGDAVGIIVAEGEIGDGQAPPGSIGGQSTAALVRKAREDKTIKAVVLRVDSPGGSAYGSELIRRELELTRAAGKPVLVSMGDLAASGGYWISMAADEVWADEATITGSIGVVALLPSIKGTMEKIGVNTTGYGTTWLASAMDPRQPQDPRLVQVVQKLIDNSYAQFLGTVAKARQSTPEKIDAVAQGRVWTGAQARERGLVDQLGGLREVVAAAAKRGQLAADAPVRYIEREPGRLQALLRQFGSSEAAWAGLAARALMVLAQEPSGPLAAGAPVLAPRALVDGVQRDLGWLARAAAGERTLGTALHCLCSAP